MDTEIVYVNPQARHAFGISLALALAIGLWMLIFAFVWGGGFWWAVIASLAVAIWIYALGEIAGAYDEKIVQVEDNDSAEGPKTNS